MNSLAEICLNEAGITNRPTVFRKVPHGTFAVYFDSVDNDQSADLINNVRSHDVTIEIYEEKQDFKARSALEAAMDERDIKWDRADTVWLEEEQYYETIYNFSYIERRLDNGQKR